MAKTDYFLTSMQLSVVALLVASGACILNKKKKRNNRPPRIFEFKGKTLIISSLLLYDSIWILGYIIKKKKKKKKKKN